MWERLTAAPASANSLLETSFGNNSALNSCKTKVDCPYIMPNKSNSEEVYYLELKAKKSISEVVTSERDLISQWHAFEVYSAAVQKERMRYYFSLSDD